MRVPEALAPLFDEGIIQEVLRPLMAGKEAQVYLVVSGERACVAKVYKEPENRSFKHRTAYVEGRRVRNSRQQRAMDKGSKYGREEIEAAWRSAEVDAIYRLRAAGVRVPEPYAYVDGVLVMELIAGEDGEPALRLADVDLDEGPARRLFTALIREVVKMLCAGIVHGDLSDFNVLMGADGPVIIDFPQAIDPAANNNARKLLVRDVNNLTSFLARFAPGLRGTQYGAEIWDLYERGVLTPDTPLTGRFAGAKGRSNVSSLLREIEDIEREARQRRQALGLEPKRPARTPVFREPEQKPPPPRPTGKQRPPDRGPKPSPPRPQKPAPKVHDPFDDLDALLSTDDE
jgi:RIO kinase 1